MKQIILGVLTVLFGLFGWSFLNTTLEKEASFSEIGVVSALFLIVFGILFSFSALFIKKRYFLFFAAGFAVLPLLAFGQNIYFLGSSVIFFLTLIWSRSKIQQEKIQQIKFHFSKVISRGLPIFLTGFSLVLAVSFAFSPQFSTSALEIPKTLFDITFNLSEKFLALQFPGFHKEITIDEFLIVGLSSQIEQMIGASGFTDVSKEMIEQQLKNLQVKKLLKEQKEKYSAALGIEIKGNEKLKDTAYQAINERMPLLIKPYQNYLPPILIFIGFTIIKPLTIPLMWLTLIMGWIILKILLVFRFCKISKEMVEKEIIIL